MKISEKLTTAGSLVLINYIIIGLIAAAISTNALHFYLALSPLIIVFIGIFFFKQASTTMAVIGFVACVILAVGIFKTDWYICLRAAIYGIIKSFGISIAIIGTMLIMFVMQEVGALKIIANAIKHVAKTKELQALFIGVAFGSFVASLGMSGYVIFPPLLVALGFGAFSAVAISILSYSATASLSLFALPVIIPAEAFGFDMFEFAYRICIYLPVLVTFIAFVILWLVGGVDSIKRGASAAILSGLTIGISSVIFVMIEVPLTIVGILASLVAILFLYGYQWANLSSSTKVGYAAVNKKELIRACSPWLVLFIFALVINIPSVTSFLKDLPGNTENIQIFADQYLDLDIFAQIYLWIFIALGIALILLKPTKQQLKNSVGLWVRKIWSPIVAFSLFFAIAYVMQWSAKIVVDGDLRNIADFESYNMNMILGTNLAKVFGHGYIYVAAVLGLFGGLASSSVTSSNMLLFKMHERAVKELDISNNGIISVYGAHSTASGVANIINPAEINSAVATVNGTERLQSELLEKHIVIAILLTIVIGIMTGIIIGYGL